MNITRPLNEFHKDLEQLRVAGPTAKLSGCTVSQLESSCSLSSNIVTRIWNRFVILITHGVWASDEAISKHLFLNVLWVNSKIADGILNGKIDDKVQLTEVMNKVIAIYSLILKDKSEDSCREFLKHTPFHLDEERLISRLERTKELLKSENLQEEFIKSANLNLVYSVPFSLFGGYNPICHHGPFYYSLYPYHDYIKSNTPLNVQDYAREKLSSICTKKFQLYQDEGKLFCWEK